MRWATTQAGGMTDSIKWIAIISAITAMVGKAYFLGQEDIKHEWDQERADFAITQMAELAETQAHLMQLEATKHANTKTIATLKRDLDGIRVRLPVHKCPAEGDLPNATSTGSDDATGSGQQLEDTQASFDDFIGILGQQAVKMDLLVEDCRVLRDWAAGLSVLP